MILIKITSKNGQYMESPCVNAEQGIALILSDGSWGQSERWVKDVEGSYDPADVIDTRTVEISPAIDAVMNDAGEIVQEAIPAVLQNEVKLKAEYTVEITDITAEHALQECIKNRKLEYPTPEEFMNAFFDGGEQALQALQTMRLAIKQKYPKP